MLYLWSNLKSFQKPFGPASCKMMVYGLWWAMVGHGGAIFFTPRAATIWFYAAPTKAGTPRPAPALADFHQRNGCTNNQFNVVKSKNKKKHVGNGERNNRNTASLKNVFIILPLSLQTYGSSYGLISTWKNNLGFEEPHIPRIKPPSPKPSKNQVATRPCATPATCGSPSL